MPSNDLSPAAFPVTRPRRRFGINSGKSGRAITERIKTWAMEQVGLPRSDLGKAVRYMLER
jgi:hypothetical protein